MRVTGIDLGSRFIKAAICEGGSLSFLKYDTVDFYKKHIIREGEKVYLDASFTGEIFATGYGRNLLKFENAEIMAEIKAHFYGAKYQSGEEEFVLVDIGGQDCKVIEAKEGYINDFTMNDKCAASTGRFMEQAARILSMPFEDLMAATKQPATLSDTCAVFCESELIGLLARGIPDMSLAAGVNLSVAKRLAPQIKRYKPEKILASGGAATSGGLMYFISELTGIEARPLANPQYNGAIGLIYKYID